MNQPDNGLEGAAMDSPMIDPWLSVKDVASALGLTPRTTRLLISEGHLAAQRHRGRVLKVRRSVLAAYMRAAPAAGDRQSLRCPTPPPPRQSPRTPKETP